MILFEVGVVPVLQAALGGGAGAGGAHPTRRAAPAMPVASDAADEAWFDVDTDTVEG